MTFQSWNKSLLDNARMWSRVKGHLDDARSLMIQIIEEGKLNAPWESFTYDFLTNTIPVVVDIVLSYADPSNECISSSMEFIQLVISVTIWASRQPDQDRYSKLLVWIERICALGWNLYESEFDRKPDPLGMIVENFVVSGDCDELAGVIDKGSLNVLRFGAIMARLAIREHLEQGASTLIQRVLDRVPVMFAEYSGEANISELKEKTMSSVMMTFALILRGMTCDYHFEKSLDFIFSLIKTFGKLKVQRLGIGMMSSVVATNESNKTALFTKWAGDSNFINYLTNKDFHIDVFAPIVAMFGCKMIISLLDTDTVSRLWKRALSAHRSQRRDWFYLLVEIMNAKKDKSEFLGLLRGTEPITSDLIEFFEVAMGRVAASTLMEIVNILFDESRTNEKAALSLVEMLKNMKEIVMEAIVNRCVTELRNSDDHTLPMMYLPIASDRLRAIPLVRHSQIRELFLSVIPYNRNLMVPEFGRIMLRSDVTMTAEEVEKLAVEIDTPFVTTMSTLLEQRGACAMDAEAFEIMASIIDTCDMTPKFAALLWPYFMVLNWRKGYIKGTGANSRALIGQGGIPKSWVFQRTPPLGLDRAIAILASSEDKEIVRIVERIVLVCIEKAYVPDIKKANVLLQEMFLPRVIHDDNPVVVERFSKVMLYILELLERKVKIGDDGAIRHHMPYNLVQIKAVLGGSTYSFFAARDSSARELQDRMRVVSAEKSVWIRCNGQCVKEDMLVSDLIPVNEKSAIVEVMESTHRKGEECQGKDRQILPSLFLCEAGLVDCLFERLAMENVGGCTWNLLEYLPDNPVIVAELDSDVAKCLEAAKSDSIPRMRYRVRCIVNRLQYMDRASAEKCWSHSCFGTLIELLARNYDARDLEEILALLLVTVDDSFIDSVDTVIIVCLRCLCESLTDSKRYAVLLLRRLVAISPNTSTFAEHSDLLEQAIHNADSEIWLMLKKSVIATSDNSAIFAKLLPGIKTIVETGADAVYMIELFDALLSCASDDFDMSEFAQTCIDTIFIRDGEILLSVCDIARVILEKRHLHVELPCDFTKELLHKVFDSTVANVRRSVFNFVTALASQVDVARAEACEFLADRMSMSMNEWSYDPAKHIRGKVPFAGLSNLGATCYMNAILQQMYHISEFRKCIASGSFESDEGRALQKLFADMSMSNERVASTRSFCNFWKGWDGVKINVREQQDAGEFLNMFLDGLPADCQELFKGTIVNTIRGISCDFSSESSEPFFSLLLDVKGLKDVYDSIKFYLQKEEFSGDDMLATDAGKIDAIKFARMKTAPINLVLHLKRFEFITGIGRVKVTDTFTFPESLDIKRVLHNSEVDDTIYNLKGVVLHRGTADGGHYSSLIKINDDWYDFNDERVEKFEMSKFRDATVGGEKHGSSAVLLFYSKMPSTDDMAFPAKDELRLAMAEEARLFTALQAIFSPETLHFVVYSQNLPLMVDYLMKVFPRSVLVEEGHVISAKINGLVAKENSREWLLKHIVGRVDDLLEIYRNCSKHEIIAAVHDVAETLISFDELPNSLVSLVNKILNGLNGLISMWRQLSVAVQIPLMVLRKWSVAIPENTRREWTIIVENLIINLYRKLSKTSKENVDLTNVFRVLSLTIPAGSVTQLVSVEQDILRNIVNAPVYHALYVKRSKCPDISAILRWYEKRRGVNPSDEIDMIIEIMRSSDFNIASYIRLTQIRKNPLPIYDVLCGKIVDGDMFLRNKVINRAQQLFLSLSFGAFSTARWIPVFLAIFFPGAPKISEHLSFRDTVNGIEREVKCDKQMTWKEWKLKRDNSQVMEIVAFRRDLLGMEKELVKWFDTPIKRKSHTFSWDMIIEWCNLACDCWSKESFDSLMGSFRCIARRATTLGNIDVFMTIYNQLMEYPEEILMREISAILQLGINHGDRGLCMRVFVDKSMSPSVIAYALSDPTVNMFASEITRTPGGSKWKTRLLALLESHKEDLTRALPEHASASPSPIIQRENSEHSHVVDIIRFVLRQSDKPFTTDIIRMCEIITTSSPGEAFALVSDADVESLNALKIATNVCSESRVAVFNAVVSVLGFTGRVKREFGSKLLDLLLCSKDIVNITADNRMALAFSIIDCSERFELMTTFIGTSIDRKLVAVNYLPSLFSRSDDRLSPFIWDWFSLFLTSVNIDSRERLWPIVQSILSYGTFGMLEVLVSSLLASASSNSSPSPITSLSVICQYDPSFRERVLESITHDNISLRGSNSARRVFGSSS